MQKLLLVYYHSKNHATSEIWKVLPSMVFPPIWGKIWRRSEHAHASYPGLSLRPPGFSPYRGREERRVQGLGYGDSIFAIDDIIQRIEPFFQTKSLYFNLCVTSILYFMKKRTVNFRARATCN